jgi:hypothetical protein
VTQATIGSTICVSGYTSRIRPPESVTEPEKLASAAAYSYTGSLHTAEYDHLISLELGGDPNDPANLWVEPNDRANATSVNNSKDTLENRLHALVCGGQLSLTSAQEAIATNWPAAYGTYVGGQSSAPSSSSPAPTAPVLSTPPPTSAAPTATCSPTTSSGNCYRVGEYCPAADHGATGTNAAGSQITCSLVGTTWRWE